MSDVCFYAAVAHSRVLCSSVQVMFIYAKIILHPAFSEGRTLCRKAEAIVVVFLFFFLQWCADLTRNIWTDLVNSFHFLTAQNKKESHTLNSHISFVLVYIYCVCDAGSLKIASTKTTPQKKPIHV